MDDAVPHGNGFDGLLATQPLGGGLKRRWHIGNVFWRKCLVDEGSAIGTGGTERRLRPDAVHLPLDVSSETAGRGIDGEHLELDARGARINDQDGIHAVHAAGSAAVLRRAWA
jgi:hypothetical protein